MTIRYRTQGFILKKEDRGEADRLFTFFTKDFGKLKILAKAVRKIKSKLRGGLELFYLSEIEFIQGKTHKTLTDAVLMEGFLNLRKDLKRLSIAYKISEVFDDLIKGQEPDKKAWNLLNEVFNKLNDIQTSNFKLQTLIYYYFLWNLFSILGYGPELCNCLFCQKKVSPPLIYFSLREGGIICRECFKKSKGAEEISPEAIKILRLIMKKDWETLSKLKIEKSYQKSLKDISEHYLKEILEKTG